MTRPAIFDNIPLALRKATPFGPCIAVVSAWHDGDTFSAFLDTGYGCYPFCAIRVAGVNAPELLAPDPVVRQRADDAHGWMFGHYPPGTALRLNSSRFAQSFTRWVATVTDANGKDIGQELVAAGYADPWSRAEVRQATKDAT